MENLTIYNLSRSVPQQAQSSIIGGRLKGMTDINPMWRIEKLTEIFGVCGFGWYYEITKQWTELGVDGIVCCFTNINLYIKDKDTNEWSKPIQGTGGSSFISKEKNGLYTSDECYKMSLTDAISVACKALGFGADIYFSKSETKYINNLNNDDTTEYKCCDCNKPFKSWTSQKGVTYQPADVFKFAQKNNPDNKPRCKFCLNKLNEVQK